MKDPVPSPPHLCQQLLDNQTTGVILLSREGRVRYMNPAAETLLSCSNTQGAGKRLFSLMEPHEASAKVLRDAAEDNHSISLREVRWTLPGGNAITVDFTVSPLNADSRQGLLLEIWPLDRKLRIGRDEQRSAIQDAAHSMLRGLAHEVKNPLGGIRGAAQLLARQNPDAKEFSDVIVAEADRLRELVDRLSAPYGSSAPRPLNVHAVLERVARLIEAEHGDEIRLVRDYDPSIPDIPGHEDLLIQAVLNLARNAVQAMLENHQRDGRLTLRSRVANRFTLHNRQHALVCKITVEDNGPGIPADLQESMFLPLVSGRAQGSGLGLSITQSVIHQHGGLLECTSLPQCTQFDIYLPLENGSEQGEE